MSIVRRRGGRTTGGSSAADWAGSRTRRRRNRIIKIVEGLPGERCAHDAFERPDEIVVFRRHQSERIAGTLRTSGAADAVDVGVGGIGHVVIDDVGYALHIEAAGGDVGGNHDVVRAILEAFEGGLALALGAVAVQAGYFKAGALDLLCHLLGTIFCAREDQHRIGLGLLQQFKQKRRLQVGRYGIQGMRHRVGGAADAHCDLLRLFERLGGKQFHIRREGGGEHHGLPLDGYGLDDASHVG